MRGIVAAPLAYWPAAATIGTNINADSSYSGMPTLSDRALTNYGIFYSGSPSPTTGLPTAAFSIKVTDAVATGDTWLNGTWAVVYESPQQVNVFADYDGLNNGAAIGTATASYNATTHVGVVQIAGITAHAGYQLRFNFDGPVTKSPKIYAPEEAAIYLSGQTVPVLTGVMRRAIAPMARLRFMDLCLANQDFIPASSAGSNFNGQTWLYPVQWSNMPQTVEDYRLINSADGWTRPIPLPMLVRAANESAKDAWFNLPILGDDNCWYQYGLYVAQNLGAGQKATFELGNEVTFNFGGGFNNYFKSMFAGLTEVRAALPATGQRNYSLQVLTFSSDGTTATLVFNQPHGANEGDLVAALSLAVGYTGFAPTGTKQLHIVSPTSVSYPCTQASTGGTVAGSTVLRSDGLVMLNAGADLAQGGYVGNLYDIRPIWFFKAQARMAYQLRRAFTDAGRSQADCRPMLANQAGAAYRYFLRNESNYINYLGASRPSVVPAGSTVGSLFSAACVANYLNFDPNTVHPGFGYTGSNATATTVDAAISQLAGKVGPPVFAYQAFVCWCLENGIDPEVYEFGTDLSGLTDISATGVASQTLADPRIGSQVILPTLRNMHEMGFKCINWFTMNTSGPGNGYGGNKTFNSGNVVSEVDPATPTAQQSPKYAAVLAAIVPPTTQRTSHAIPCTLDGNEFVGNEPGGAYQFTGYITGSTLTVVSWIQYGGAAMRTGTLLPVSLTIGGTQITSNASANADGTGTYTVSNSQNVGSAGSPVTFMLYPALNDTNAKYTATSYGYTGPNAQSKAYRFWSEQAGTRTLTVTVDVAGGAASTLTAAVIGGAAAAPVATPAGPQAGYVLPTIQLAVNAGANYVSLSSPSGTVLIQSVQLA